MMANQASNPLFRYGQNPWIMLIVLVLISIGGVFVIGNVLAFVVAIIMTGGFDQLQAILLNPTNYPEQRMVILVMQGLSSFGGFIISPIIFYYLMVKGNFAFDFFRLPANIIRMLAVTVVMVFSFMVVNTVFIEWNANLQLPEVFSGFEQWATELEESLADLTKFLTTYDSNVYFIFSIVVIAVIPAIGEELLFRGLLQNIFHKLIKNEHLAIWIAAFLFSAIHFQFYGFIPRMLLGALFGYLYLWSGNLLVPIVAHFVNNGVSLFTLFFYQRGYTEFDAESTEALPIAPVIVFAIVFVITFVYFKKNLIGEEENEGLERGV